MYSQKNKQNIHFNQINAELFRTSNRLNKNRQLVNLWLWISKPTFSAERFYSNKTSWIAFVLKHVWSLSINDWLIRTSVHLLSSFFSWVIERVLSGGASCSGFLYGADSFSTPESVRTDSILSASTMLGSVTTLVILRWNLCLSPSSFCSASTVSMLPLTFTFSSSGLKPSRSKSSFHVSLPSVSIGSSFFTGDGAISLISPCGVRNALTDLGLMSSGTPTVRLVSIRLYTSPLLSCWWCCFLALTVTELSPYLTDTSPGWNPAPSGTVSHQWLCATTSCCGSGCCKYD